MNTEEQRKKMKMMRKQLGVIYDIAIELKKDKVLTYDEFTKTFEHMIRAMEDCIDAAIERIECIHPAIEIVSMNDHYGYGTIDMVWRCKDCGVEMEGQIDMQELWHHDMTAKEIQDGFEVKA